TRMRGLRDPSSVACGDTFSHKGRRDLNASEHQRAGFLHVGQGLDAAEQGLVGGLVDADQGDGVLAGVDAAEVEGGDVDARVGQQAADGGDEAGLIEVVDVEHGRAERGVEVHALDL